MDDTRLILAQPSPRASYTCARVSRQRFHARIRSLLNAPYFQEVAFLTAAAGMPSIVLFGSTQLDGFGRGGYLFAVFWVTSAVLFGMAR